MKLLFSQLFVLLFIAAGAQTKSSFDRFKSNNPENGFLENKGQFHDQDYNATPDVKYLICLGNGLNVQLRSNGFSYDTYSVDDNEMQAYLSKQASDENFSIKFHRIDISLVNANENPTIIAEDPIDGFINFYNGISQSNEATNVRSYRKLTYCNIYPFIDLVFEASAENINPFKYSFVVRPGADVNSIRLHYKGANQTFLQNNEIFIKTDNGNIIENIPACWILETNKQINIEYQKYENDCYGFSGAESFQNTTLIIDPTPNIVWGTYCGSSNIDAAYGLCFDKAGFIYITGQTTSTTSVATAGAHQSTFGGNSDGFIKKFNKDGYQLWGTYYGGSGFDRCAEIACDSIGNVFINGFAGSSNGIASIGAHQEVYMGSYDCFIAKFNSNGVRLWGTYLGGTGDDEGCGISCDRNGNVIVTGYTSSTTGIATTGAYQETLGNAGFDAFVSKFNTNGTCLWSTYYGGPGNDLAKNVNCDTNCNIYMVGYGSSSSGIATAGAHQASFGGMTDGFLVKLDSGGVPQWGTYYGGSSDDWLTDVCCDTSQNIFISGKTSSSSAISTPGAQQVSIGGNADNFIVKFDNNGTRIWATYLGGANTEFEYGGLVCDSAGNVYFSGSSNSNTQIATPNSYQDTLSGIEDAFIVKYSNNGVKLWGSYFGGASSDQGRGIVYDGDENLYIAGSTQSVFGIAINSPFQGTSGGGWDAFLAKFATCENPIIPDTAQIIAGPTVVCQGQTSVTYLTMPINNADEYVWTMPSGTTVTNTTNSISVDFDSSAVSGTLSVFGQNECANGSPAMISINVNPLPSSADTIFGNTVVCQGDNNVNYSLPPITNATSYEWYLPFNSSGTSSTNSINVNYSSTAVSGYLTVYGSNACGLGLPADLFITINEAPLTPTISLLAGPVLQSSAPTGNQWYNQYGLISGATNQTYNVTQNGNYYVDVTLTGCNSDTSNHISITSGHL